jgi:hypothetical protein
MSASSLPCMIQVMIRSDLPRTTPLSLAARVLGLELAARVRGGLRATGLRRPPRAVDEALLTPPDSALATRAAALVRALSPPFLVHHCERTFAFGAAIGHALGRRVDRELLYVAAALHDLGLTDAHQGERPFELRGADAARAFCLDGGCPAARADLVHEAIALHTSVQAARREPEIALLHFGAGADVVGYRAEELAPETIAAVVARWPRLGFKRCIAELLAREARRTPGSPLGVQWRLGFGKRVARAPFAE